MENQFCSMKQHWIYQTHFGTYLCSVVESLHKSDTMFFSGFFLFRFFFKRGKYHRVGDEENGGGSGSNLGTGKEYNRNKL